MPALRPRRHPNIVLFSFLTNPRTICRIVGPTARCSARSHEAPERQAGRGKRGRRSGQPHPGPEAGNCDRPVERREAQRLDGRVSQALRSSPARASGRVSHTRPNGGIAKPRSGKVRRCSEEMPGTIRGAVAQRPWRLPALHSPFGETEKGTGGAHAEQNNRAAERWLKPLRASPESITTRREIETETERYGKCRGYGLRLSLALGRNDARAGFALDFQSARSLIAIGVSVPATNRARNWGEIAAYAPT